MEELLIEFRHVTVEDRKHSEMCELIYSFIHTKTGKHFFRGHLFELFDLLAEKPQQDVLVVESKELFEVFGNDLFEFLAFKCQDIVKEHGDAIRVASSNGALE
jgi:hypothetical protein